MPFKVEISDSFKRISKELTPQQKDMLLFGMFNLLWQTYETDDWESVLTNKEYKAFEEIFKEYG